MSLPTPIKVRKLQKALHAKAKAKPGFRFYALYDKVYRPTSWLTPTAAAVPTAAAGRGRADVRADRGVRGGEVAGRTGECLRKRTYRPGRSGGFTSPRPDGKQRPLGIPAVRDRVVQTAALLVLGPSSRPTSSRSSTPTARAATPWTRCSTSSGC